MLLSSSRFRPPYFFIKMNDVLLNLISHGQNPLLNHLKKFSWYHPGKQTNKFRNKVTSSAPDPRTSCLRDSFCFPAHGKHDMGSFVTAIAVAELGTCE